MPLKKIEQPHATGKYIEQPGIDPEQMTADSTAWRVSSSDVQGPGTFRPLGEFAGPYVGDAYSGVSGLGNERRFITYEHGGMGKSPRTKLNK